MLIIYTLSRGKVSTLVVYKNAKPTRGDVFTAGTNSVHTTAAGTTKTGNGDLNSQNAVGEVSTGWDLDSVNTRVPLTKVVLLLSCSLHSHYRLKIQTRSIMSAQTMERKAG